MRVYILACILAAPICFYVMCVHHTENYELEISRNLANGETKASNIAGYHVTAPWVQVVKIDTRPMRVCITTSGRGFNCKLVQFVPDKWKEFVETEGFHYYWWSNRFSVNSGYNDEYRGLKDILRGDAYSVQPFSFIQIVQE